MIMKVRRLLRLSILTINTSSLLNENTHEDLLLLCNSLYIEIIYGKIIHKILLFFVLSAKLI